MVEKLIKFKLKKKYLYILYFLRKLRNDFFYEIGKSRLKRIIMCSFIISLIWNFADLLSHSLNFNFIHDFICLLIGIIGERIIPWGKTSIRNSSSTSNTLI